MNLKQFTNTKEPVVLIYGIRAPFIIKIVEFLRHQKSRILLTDHLSSKTKELLKRLPVDNKKVMFIHYNSLYTRLPRLQRLNYIIYNLTPVITGTEYPALTRSKPVVSNRQYVIEAKTIEDVIKLAIEFNAAFSLVLPAYLHQFMCPVSELSVQLYEHSLYLFESYYKQSRVNGRVIKVAETVGKEMDLSQSTFTTFVIKEAIKKHRIVIPGDALVSLSLISNPDASRGILDTLLKPKTRGKKIKLEHSPSLSVLGLVHTISEMLDKGIKVDTKPEDKSYLEVAKQRSKLTLLEDGISAEKYGTAYTYPLEKAITDVLERLIPQKAKLPTSKPKRRSKTSPALTEITLTRPKHQLNIKEALINALSRIFGAPADVPSLEYKGLRILPFIMFVFNFILTIILAFITAPILYFSVRYTLLKQTLQQTLKTFEISSQQLGNLQALYNEINIRFPESVRRLKIPLIQEVEQTLTTANSIIELAKWHLNVLQPIKEYLVTQDPQKINYLIQNAEKNPTYLSEIYVQLNSLVESLPKTYKAQQEADSIRRFSFVYGILPDLLGYKKPITWIIAIPSNESTAVFNRFVVENGTFIKTKNEDTPLPLEENPATSQSTVMFVFNRSIINKLAQLLNVNQTDDPYITAKRIYEAYIKAPKETKQEALLVVLDGLQKGEIAVVTGNQRIAEYFACVPVCR